ncbi:hypothetical protein DPMN_097968 [Dreissena polymorpha]|uniref:Uncharacterized protein n=1 Tax=Dreissena polymorpha TaxID=45954 RepID=A0A9D4LE93_DREPO|nr:hypothetical protein DPMN_097968 [Dreissena polymorpha]
MAFHSSGSVGVWITPLAHQCTVTAPPPVAKNLKVIANFKSGLMDCLNQVWFFVILGPTTCNSSWNISGPILVKFLNASGSSAISSGIKVSYWARAGRLESQSLIHHLILLL